MKAENPHYLIAMPQLTDPNFHHGVVLMITHNKEGAVGLVVNKPLEMTLGQFAKSQEVICHLSLQQLPVYQGGPVEPEHGWILHRDSQVQEKQEIMPGIFLSGTLVTLYELMEKGAHPLKLILGYAGWSAHQLESEMQVGAWLSQKPEAKYAFYPNPESTWNVILKDMGIDPAQLSSVSGVH